MSTKQRNGTCELLVSDNSILTNFSFFIEQGQKRAMARLAELRRNPVSSRDSRSSAEGKSAKSERRIERLKGKADCIIS